MESMVASGTGLLGVDHELLLEFQTELLGGLDPRLTEVRIFFKVCLRIIRKVVNLFQRAQILFWSAVAIKAPAHRVGLRLVNDFHLIDVAVAGLAGNPAIDVRRMIEINVVR